MRNLQKNMDENNKMDEKRYYKNKFKVDMEQKIPLDDDRRKLEILTHL